MAKKSRRMQKQGPPPPLDESLVSGSKRKAPTAVPSTSQPSKKRKRSSNVGGIEPPDVKKRNQAGKSKAPIQARETAVSGSSSKKGSKQHELVKKTRVPENDEDEISLDSQEASIVSEEGSAKDSDVLEDEFDDLPSSEAAQDESEQDKDSDDFFDSEQEEADATKREGMWSDDSDSGDSSRDQATRLNAANIEGLSHHLDAKAAREAADAQAELEEAAIQTNIAGDQIPGLEDNDVVDSDEEAAQLGLKTRLAPDLQLLRSRIADTIRLLDDFSKHAASAKTKGDASFRSRADYTKQLLRDISTYYGYSTHLAEKLFDLFSPREAFAFFEANETPRPVVIRTNTLRTHRRELAQSLINRGVVLEPVGKWSKVGLQVFEAPVPLGATPEYLAGHYIIQSASSFLPVMALAPQEHERVLDMAAAPGGKTTYISALMKNTGAVFANDSNKTRAKALIGNTHRLGAKNTIVSSLDAATAFPKALGGFDRVLLDAPCSGTGVIAKDPSVKTNKTEKDFIRLPELQKKLLLAAIDSVDHASSTGGYIVYSTCSVAVEENEAVVAYALSRRGNVKLVDTGLSFGREGFANFKGKHFGDSVKLCRRFYPHAYNLDGFFVSKFKKTGPTPKGASGATGPVVNGSEPVTKAINGDAAAGKHTIPGSTVSTIAEGLPTPSRKGMPNGTRVDTDSDDTDPFGADFDNEEDDAIIERSRRAQLKRRGVNPNADRSKAQGKSKSKGVKPNGNAAFGVSKDVNGDLEVERRVEGAGNSKKIAVAAAKMKVKENVGKSDKARPRVSEATRRTIKNGVGIRGALS